MLLLGVQGCGKSMLAKATAAGFGVPLLRLDFATLYNKYHGETEKNLRDALASAEFAASEADRAQASADQGVADTTAVLNQVQSSGNQILVDAEAVLQQVIARLLAVGLPDSLIGARGMLLKVKVDESGYELVHTAALPRFYGFALSSDGSELLLTEGRDANFNAQDFLAWTLAEGVTFALHQNALEVQL